MAQMPIQLVAGRAQNYLAPPPPAPAPKPAQAPAGTTQAIDPGAISGGKLRPGAIDQMTFRQRMAALNRADPPTAYPAGNAVRTPAPAATAVKSSAAIPTLTPAQLAALGVDISNMDFTTPPAETPPAETPPAETPTAEAPAATLPDSVLDRYFLDPEHPERLAEDPRGPLSPSDGRR